MADSFAKAVYKDILAKPTLRYYDGGPIPSSRNVPSDSLYRMMPDNKHYRLTDTIWTVIYEPIPGYYQHWKWCTECRVHEHTGETTIEEKEVPRSNKLQTAKQIAETRFQLKWPCTQAELRDAFKLMLERLDGQDMTSYGKLLEDYDQVLNHFRLKQVDSVKTADGYIYEDLGLGLPPEKASMPCGRCSGKGWHEFEDDMDQNIRCVACFGKGAVYLGAPGKISQGTIAGVLNDAANKQTTLLRMNKELNKRLFSGGRVRHG